MQTKLTILICLPVADRVHNRPLVWLTWNQLLISSVVSCRAVRGYCSEQHCNQCFSITLMFSVCTCVRLARSATETFLTPRFNLLCWHSWLTKQLVQLRHRDVQHFCCWSQHDTDGPRKETLPLHRFSSVIHEKTSLAYRYCAISLTSGH